MIHPNKAWSPVMNPVALLCLALVFSVWLLNCSARAETATPLDQPLPAGEESLIACTSPYGTQQQVPDWPEDGLFHYRLYVPDDYEAQGQDSYPLMFIASPKGEARMEAATQALQRDRWLVAMLVESSNASVLWYPNFVAAHDDLLKRVRVQQNMLFCTGLSGGARVCGMFPSIRPGFKGLILQGAGFARPPKLVAGADTRLAVFGTFGARDFNLHEAGRLRRSLPPTIHRLIEVWDGGHAWAPAPVFERGLDWMVEQTLIEAPYDATMEKAYRWYFRNQVRRYDQASDGLTRALQSRIVQDLRDRWPLALDTAATARVQAMAEAHPASDPPALAREAAARAAFREALVRDDQGHGRNFAELIQAYGDIQTRYPDTLAAAQAAIRKQSLQWEDAP